MVTHCNSLLFFYGRTSRNERKGHRTRLPEMIAKVLVAK